MINTRLFSLLFILLFSQGIKAQSAEFETASEAVKNMKIGWNLVNTLDTQKRIHGSSLRVGGVGRQFGAILLPSLN